MRRYGLLPSLAVLLLTAPGWAGTLYYSMDSNMNGLYTLDTATGAATHVGTSGVWAVTVGLAPSSDPASLWGSAPYGLLDINTDGSGATMSGTAGIEGMAYDPGSDTLYGSLNGSLFTLDTGTGNVSATISAAGYDIEGLAFGGGGVYGLSSDGNLHFYNIGTDSWTVLGSLGIGATEQSGLAYDTDLNLLYAGSASSGNLYSVNPLTLTTALVGDTGLGSLGGGLAYVSTIPEPTGLAWLCLGGLVVLRRKRRG